MKHFLLKLQHNLQSTQIYFMSVFENYQEEQDTYTDFDCDCYLLEELKITSDVFHSLKKKYSFR